MREMKRGTRRSIGRLKARAKYAEYMRSFKWWKRRQLWVEEELKKHGLTKLFCITGCGKEWVLGEESSHMHHYTYVRLGAENHEDLWQMCQPCHYKLHELIERKDWQKTYSREQANKKGLALIKYQIK